MLIIFYTDREAHSFLPSALPKGEPGYCSIRHSFSLGTTHPVKRKDEKGIDIISPVCLKMNIFWIEGNF